MANTKLKLENTEIQQRGFCNWCRNGLIHTTEKLTQKNLVDTGKKFADGSVAYALYCNQCLEDEQRVNQPKSVVNLNTLDEINISELPEPKELKEMQKARDETLKATGVKEVTETAIGLAQSSSSSTTTTNDNKK